MSSLSLYNEQENPIQPLCSRRAQHTFEVTISREPASHDFSVVEIWPDTEGIKCHSEGELSSTARYDNNLEDTAGASGDDETPPSLEYDIEAVVSTQETPRHGPPPPPPTYYFDAHRGQYRTTEQGKHLLDGTIYSHIASLTTARQKFIEFLQTDEFFHEYSFLSVMVILLVHVFHLSAAVIAMGCYTPSIVHVFVSVWEFMQNKVEDIFTTNGGSRVGFKCAIFTIELIVIFVCIFLFLWAVFIPVCKSLAGITSKILYLFT